MSVEEHLAALDAKLRALAGVIASSVLHREIDASLSIGFIKGYIEFTDGSRLEFSEQLPAERQRYRLHYMDAHEELIIRWDSAPHHRDLSTFPFHQHTPAGVEEHPAFTLLEAIDEVVNLLEV